MMPDANKVPSDVCEKFPTSSVATATATVELNDGESTVSVDIFAYVCSRSYFHSM